MNRLNEVVFPASRAIFDDDSDGEEKQQIQKEDSEPVFRWNKKLTDDGGKVTCECLFLAVGQVATGFIDSLFCSDERETLCSICCGGSNTLSSSWSQTAPSDSSSFIWRRKGRPDIAVCQCREDVSRQQSFMWAEKFFSTVKPTTVIILDSRSIADLKTGSELLANRDYFPLQALRTSALMAQPCCSYLEPPNTVESLSAEVLSYCEVHHIPAILYMAYISDRDPLAQLIAVFTPILSCTIIQPFIQDVSQQLAAEQKKLSSVLRDTGSLYM